MLLHGQEGISEHRRAGGRYPLLHSLRTVALADVVVLLRLRTQHGQPVEHRQAVICNPSVGQSTNLPLARPRNFRLAEPQIRPGADSLHDPADETWPPPALRQDQGESKGPGVAVVFLLVGLDDDADHWEEGSCSGFGAAVVVLVGSVDVVRLPVQVRAVRPPPRRNEDGERQRAALRALQPPELLARGLPIGDQLHRAPQGRSEERLLPRWLPRGLVPLREHEELLAVQDELRALRLRCCPHRLDEGRLRELATPLVHPGVDLRLHGAAPVESQAVSVHVGVPRADPQLRQIPLPRAAHAARTLLLGAVRLCLGRSRQRDGQGDAPILHRQQLAEHL
mmetsp:Transcript_58168/g.147542  ORF Transcript_58168/g.147542 Transcript_58168/m.147542 type:complete len:338 (-) Transcript_58168:796-1809(-)